MVPFESLGTVSYSHPVATMAVYLAVSTQYTNVTDTQPDTALRQEPRYAASLDCGRAAKNSTSLLKALFALSAD